MSDTTTVYLIIAGIVVLFVSNRFPVELVGIASALALYFTDTLTLEQTLSGFGDPTVIFIASLFVVSEALQTTGVTTWASQQLMNHAGDSFRRLMILTMLLVATMSALITPNGAVSALVPVAVVLALQVKRSPSEMLLPLSFASFGGALLVLTGSPVNVLVADASRDAGAGGFNYFEFAIVGVPILLGTIVITVFLGPRLLPQRRPRSMPEDFSKHARTLLAQYALDVPLYRLQVPAGSPLVGVTREQVDLAPFPGVAIVTAQEQGGSGPLARAELAAGDFLVVRGDSSSARALAAEYGLHVAPLVSPSKEQEVYTRETGVAEVLIPPRSQLIGERVFPGMVTDSGDLVVLAVARGGDHRPGKTDLQAGDTLILQGRWEALDLAGDPSVVVVDSPDAIRRQVVPLTANAGIAIAVLAAMVIALASGTTRPAVVALVAAGVLILLRVMTVGQAYRSISWTVVILIGAMIPLSTAMTETGAANEIAEHLADAVGDSSPYVLLIALFVLVAVMGQLLSNTATALIVIPVAVATAAELDVSVQPVLMSMLVAASASFLTPIATTPNLMVLEPGGYNFGDYWKFGAPLMLLYFVIAILWVPLFWRF